MLAARFMGRIVWGGVIASPLVGLIVARIYLPIYARSSRIRWLMALVTLYVARRSSAWALGFTTPYRRLRIA